MAAVIPNSTKLGRKAGRLLGRWTSKLLRQKQPLPPQPMSKSRRIQAKWAELQDGIPARLRRIESLLANKDIDSAADVAAWFQNYRDMLDLYFWLEDPETSKAAHFAYSVDLRHACVNYCPTLIEAVPRFGYHGWARKIREYVGGADVLDIGCGSGLYGTAFLMMGAKSYTGVDPSMALDSRRIKDKTKRKPAELPMTLREMSDRCPAITLISETYENFSAAHKFDLISLHNVTEHLNNIDTILLDVRRHARDDGRLVYNHHNFYCWNGHHGAPRNAAQIDPASCDQQKLIDWNHVLNADRFLSDHYLKKKLNRIRIDELKRLTRINFDIDSWSENPSPPDVLERLTPEIWDKLQAFDNSLTRTDLETNVAICVATPKQNPSQEGRDDAAG